MAQQKIANSDAHSVDSLGAPRLVIVDDDKLVAHSLGQWLTLSGFDAAVVSSAEEAEHLVAAGPAVDAVISDMRMPARDGLDLLESLRRQYPDLPVVLLSGHADIPMAVAALKAGAFDFLAKPVDPERLATTMRNAAAQARLARRVRSLEARLSGSSEIEARILGHAPATVALRAQVGAIATLPLDVILRGETGAGKEVVAEALHVGGRRVHGRFVAVNCAAIPQHMFESELFGHEAGAYTGARHARIGKLEHASGGTIFLDEIESMPYAAQGKILRALQERSIERLGSNRSIPVDLRVIAATKVDLAEASRAGRFRMDLYYRLAGVEIAIPPLRERHEDVLFLFSIFASRMAARAGRGTPAPLGEAETAALLAHLWPGNVRELRTIAERHALGLQLGLGERRAPGSQPATLHDRVAAYETGLIRAALSSGEPVAIVAERLGVPRRTLNEKMQRYGIRRKGD